MACRPASTMMKDRPRFCQIEGSATANMAMSGSLNQLTWNTPTAGLSRNRKITEVTAVELASVEGKIVWKALMPLRRRGGAPGEREPTRQPRRHRVEDELEAVPDALAEVVAGQLLAVLAQADALE